MTPKKSVKLNREAKLIKFVPELVPTGVGVGQGAKGENNPSTLLGPFGPTAAHANLDQRLAGRLCYARANGQPCCRSEGIRHLVFVIAKVGNGCLESLLDRWEQPR